MAQLKTGTTIGGRDVMLEMDNLNEEVIAHLAEIEKHRKIFIGYDEPVGMQIDDIWLDLNPQRIVLADWRMNELSGNIVQDYSGNGYHGTVEGTVNITDPINEGSVKSRTGDGTTGVIKTQFNALYGLSNFKVELFCKRNSSKEGWSALVNNYRNSTNNSTGFHISHHEGSPSYGVAVTIYTVEGRTSMVDGLGTGVYSGVVLAIGQIYKIELEYDGALAMLKIYEVEADGSLTLIYNGIEPLTGLMRTEMLPLTMLANNSATTGEFSSFTLGRVRITTLEV